MSATEIITNQLRKEGKSEIEIADLIEEIYCLDLGESLEEWADEILESEKSEFPK